MSDYITTLQDAYREFCIQAHGVGRTIRRRAAEERGQTAAEYMGILLVVALIISALFVSGIGDAIAGAAGKMVTHISKGEKPN
jgi:Flp pilus assembly pilin Flp